MDENFISFFYGSCIYNGSLSDDEYCQDNDSEHNPDPNPESGVDIIAGVKKGAPMTFEEADSGRCNPYYNVDGLNGYDANCQTCAAVFIARLRGYNVRALPNWNNAFIFNLSKDPTLAYESVGESPDDGPLKGEDYYKELDEILDEGDYFGLWWFRLVKKDDVADTVKDEAIIEARTGHICIVTKRNGEIQFYDPQRNELMPDEDSIAGYMSTADKSTMRIMDLTYVGMNTEYCSYIMKGV